MATSVKREVQLCRIAGGNRDIRVRCDIYAALRHRAEPQPTFRKKYRGCDAGHCCGGFGVAFSNHRRTQRPTEIAKKSFSEIINQVHSNI